MNELSAADIMALSKDGDNSMGSGIWNNPFIYFVWMALFSGGAFGNGWGNNAATQGALTRAELYDGLNYTQLDNGIKSVDRDLFTQSTSMLQGFNSLDRTLCDGFGGVQMAITANRYAADSNSAATNRNIDSVRYDNAMGQSAIVNSSLLNTRDIIDSQTAGFQKILDKLCEQETEALRSELQTYKLAANNAEQTQDIVNSLRTPAPVPAYLVNRGCGCNGGYGTVSNLV